MPTGSGQLCFVVLRHMQSYCSGVRLCSGLFPSDPLRARNILILSLPIPLRLSTGLRVAGVGAQRPGPHWGCRNPYYSGITAVLALLLKLKQSQTILGNAATSDFVSPKRKIQKPPPGSGGVKASEETFGGEEEKHKSHSHQRDSHCYARLGVTEAIEVFRGLPGGVTRGDMSGLRRTVKRPLEARHTCSFLHSSLGVACTGS